MKERVVSKLAAVWMTTAVISLILPVFLPSYPGASVIEAALITMFAISFPGSLLGLPLLFSIEVLAGIDPASISGKYFLVTGFFAIGLLQWFRIIPWIFRNKDVEGLDLSESI